MANFWGVAGIARREADRYGLEQEALKNAREDRALALEDRARRISIEDRQGRVADMQMERMGGEMQDWRRQRDMRERFRSAIRQGTLDRDQERKTFEDYASGVTGFSGPEPAAPRSATSIADDAMKDPQYGGDPEWTAQVNEWRKRAEAEGLATVYNLYKQGASDTDIARAYNAQGSHYIVRLTREKNPNDPTDDVLVGEDANGKRIPISMKELGRRLGSSGEWTFGAWGAGNKDTGEMRPPPMQGKDRYMTYKPDGKREVVIDLAAGPENVALQLAASMQSAGLSEDVIKRFNDAVDQNYKRGQMDQFDDQFSSKLSNMRALGSRLLENGIANADGQPLTPEEVANVAAMVATGKMTIEDVMSRYAPTRGQGGGMPASAGGTTAPQAGGAAASDIRYTLPPNTLFVQGNKPTSPPDGAPDGGMWRRDAQKGWYYFDPKSRQVWSNEGGAPAAPAAGGAPAATPVSDNGSAAPATPQRSTAAPRAPSSGDTKVNVQAFDAERASSYNDGQLAYYAGQKDTAPEVMDQVLAEARRRGLRPVRDNAKGGFKLMREDAPQKAGTAKGPAKPMMVGEPLDVAEPGNIDLDNRKVLKNPDGTISTESSITITEDGKHVLIPTVVDGKRLSDREAVAHYRKTGEHLGKFLSAEGAESYANELHLRQEQRYAPKGSALERRKGAAGASGSWDDAGTDESLPKAVIKYAKEAAKKVPARPKSGFKTWWAGNYEFHHFADGEVGFFMDGPGGKGVLWYRIDPKTGEVSGRPVSSISKQKFMEMHSGNRKGK